MHHNLIFQVVSLWLIVNQFNYPGMLFNYNGKFNETQKHVAQQGRKAYFAINSKLKSQYFNVQNQCSVLILVLIVYSVIVPKYGGSIKPRM